MQNSGEIPKAEAEEMRTRKKSEIFEANFALTCKVMGTLDRSAYSLGSHFVSQHGYASVCAVYSARIQQM